MQPAGSFGTMVLGVALGAGVALAGHFVSKTMVNAKVAINTAEAKGLAERRVRADRADWSIIHRVSGATRASVPALYEEAKRNQETIVALLRESGFDDAEIDLGVLDYEMREYRDDEQRLVDEAHILVGTIRVETDAVDRVAAARATVNQLIARGLDIESPPPAYRFTKLNEIKPDMLREATKNARIAANEFAANADVEVGGIRSARQGGFIIRDAGAAYGDTEKIEKDVRVVTTITFYLTE